MLPRFLALPGFSLANSYAFLPISVDVQFWLKKIRRPEDDGEEEAGEPLLLPEHEGAEVPGP